MDAATRRRIVGEVEFKAFSIDDVADIAHLISSMSDDGGRLWLRDKSPEYYRWMYFDNPAGAAIGCLARHEGRIVSSFAIAPKVMQVAGRRRVLGKTMDMFTDPDYQGLGLMGRCAEWVFEHARAAGIEAWYVTPSPNSYPIFTTRWGYTEDFTLLYRARVLDAPAVLSALSPLPGAPAWVERLGVPRLRHGSPRRPRLPDGWTAAPLAAFGPEVDALWRAVGPGHRVAIVRDAAYLTWRYLDNPDEYSVFDLRQQGVLRGLVVTKQTIRRGLPVHEVVDLVAPARDAQIVALLLRVAVSHARRCRGALVEAWSIRGTWLDRQFVRAGLALPRTSLPFLLSPGQPDRLLRDAHAWLLTQGDGNDV